MSDKTEAPSPRRMQRARDQGNVPVSSALTQGTVLAVAFMLVSSALSVCALRVTELVRLCLTSDLANQRTLLMVLSGRALLESVVPLLLALAGTATIVGVVQTGAVFAPSRIHPDLSKLSPLSFFSSLFSSKRLFTTVRALMGMLLVGYLVVHRVQQHAGDLVRAMGNARACAQVAAIVMKSVLRDTVLVALALGIADLALTRRHWLKGLMMTKQEVKQEHKESEGDPQLKAAREQAHQEMMSAASINAVRDATVVIVNPTHLANALRYDPERDEAPTLLSKGQGALAAQIIRAAQDYGIPVVQDIPLAHALAELSEGEEIAPELYEAVAAILQELWESEPSLAPKP